MDATLKKTSLKRENKIDWSSSLGWSNPKGLMWFRQSHLFSSSLRKIKGTLLSGWHYSNSIQSSCFNPPPPPPYPQQWHLPSFFANDTQLRALHDFCGHYYLWVSTSMEVNTLAHIGCLILTKSPRLKWYVSLSCAVGSSGEWLMTLEWNKVKYITWQHLSRHSERGSCQVVWLVWVIQLVK